MRENPILRAKAEYFRYIKIKKIKPILMSRRCESCKNDIKREQMYECSLFDDYYENVMHYYCGCSQCFSSKADFRTYLENKKLILTEEDWMTGNGRPCYPIQKKILNSLRKISREKRR